MRKPFMVEFTGTPEAGKTTTIRNVANKLVNDGFNVIILKESAESLPKEIPKGTWDANLWMHYQTQSSILRAKYSDADICLVDRGLIDSRFYGKKFLWENVCTEEEYEDFCKQFIKDLFPDYLICLTVTPEEAIRRRGGNGRLINEEYLRKYNYLFFRYYSELSYNKTIFNTACMSVHEMNDLVYNSIKAKLLP